MADEQVVDQTDTNVENQEEATSEAPAQETSKSIYEDQEQESPANETQEDADSEKSEDEKDDEDKEGAPDQYEFKLPEGMEQALDEDAIAEFSEVAKELNLTQDQAQKLVDIQTGLMNKIGERLQDEFSEVQDTWKKEAQTDEQYGGKNFEENIGFAKKAIDAFASEEFKEALEVTGMGNHPELIRFCIEVGKRMSEDGVMSGGNQAAGAQDPAKTLFPEMA